MACFLNLNQLDRDGTSSPIVVNLDRVCLIARVTKFDDLGRERAQIFFDYDPDNIKHGAIITIENQHEIYLMILSYKELWEKT
jgi:hypothetical protein